MEQYIKGLSHRIEFVIVIFVAFGYFVLTSVISVLSPVGEQAITNVDLLFLLLYEVILLVFLGLFLRLRGWQPRQLGLMPAPRDIRLVYHLYQGPVGAVSIIPLGLVFAYWFAKTGRLWPLVIAHAIIDFFALLVFVSRL